MVIIWILIRCIKIKTSVNLCTAVNAINQSKTNCDILILTKIKVTGIYPKQPLIAIIATLCKVLEINTNISVQCWWWWHRLHNDFSFWDDSFISNIDVILNQDQVLCIISHFHPFIHQDFANVYHQSKDEKQIDAHYIH